MLNMNTPIPASTTIKAWQCIGCGRLEAPQDCIGVCEYRKVEVVGAHDHANALRALDEANERIAVLERVLAKLAHVTPNDGAWKDCYLALQMDARALMSGESAAR
jgi:hypothetical protein